jgi:ATP-dependent Clp protease protease subunit
MYNIPTVLEGYGTQQRAWDLYSRMMNERVLFCSGEVRAENMNILIASVLHLDHTDNTKPIYLYINSNGGSCQDGLAFMNTLEICQSPIVTICTGMAASMGAMILSDKYSNKPGNKRMILPDARVMIHSVASGFEGKVQDMRISFKEAEMFQEKLMRRLAINTGKSYEQIVKDCDRDLYLSAEEAVEYGLVDEIVRYKPSQISVA